MSVKLMKFITF